MPKKSTPKPPAKASPKCPKGHELVEQAGMLVCNACQPRYMSHKPR